MKNFASIASLIATLALAPAAYAGGDGECHFHGNAPAKESVVTGCAKQQKDALAAKGKIDASWKTVALEKAVDKRRYLPEIIRLHNELGQVYSYRGNMPKAIEQFEQWLFCRILVDFAPFERQICLRN